MKNLFLLMIAGGFVTACSKETIERPTEPEPISFTQIRKMYNDQGKYDKTLLVIHFHRVIDPVLIAQYKALPAMKAMCDEQVNNDTMYTIISKPCPADCGINRIKEPS